MFSGFQEASLVARLNDMNGLHDECFNTVVVVRPQWDCLNETATFPEIPYGVALRRE